MSFFPTNLRVLRNTLNETQLKMSERLGVKHRTYQAWEEGRAEPDNKMLIKIASTHGVTISDLVIIDLTKQSPEQTKDNLVITRYNLACDNVRGQIDLLLNIS